MPSKASFAAKQRSLAGKLLGTHGAQPGPLDRPSDLSLGDSDRDSSKTLRRRVFALVPDGISPARHAD